MALLQTITTSLKSRILRDKVLTDGTWNFAIVDTVAPMQDEIILRKSRPRCFAGTMLDRQLRSWGLDTAMVVGIACNVGAEWTQREVMSTEYFLQDTTILAGRASPLDTTISDVEKFVGWVADANAFDRTCDVMAALK